MYVLIFDTETTGLPDKGARGQYDHPSQPYPVSIAAVLCDDKLDIVESFHHFVKLPPGVKCHPKAEETHGITPDVLEAKGIEQADALTDFKALSSKAAVHMAYNISFDVDVMHAMNHRLTGQHADTFAPESKSTCLMKLSSNFLRIPGGVGGGYRQLKLFQAYRRICGVPMESVYKAHDALEDVMACRDIYYKMLEAVSYGIPNN